MTLNLLEEIFLKILNYRHFVVIGVEHLVTSEVNGY